jgi:hypothetical protein
VTAFDTINFPGANKNPNIESELGLRKQFLHVMRGSIFYSILRPIPNDAVTCNDDCCERPHTKVSYYVISNHKMAEVAGAAKIISERWPDCEAPAEARKQNVLKELASMNYTYDTTGIESNVAYNEETYYLLDSDLPSTGIDKFLHPTCATSQSPVLCSLGRH